MLEVILSRDAARALEKQPVSIRRRLIAALEKLTDMPLQGKKLHGELAGLASLRVGGFRAIYEINQSAGKVIVHAIGSRGDVYKK